MTRVDPAPAPAAPLLTRAEAGEVVVRRPQPAGVNVAGAERAVSVAAGAVLTLLGGSRRNLPGLLVAGLGGGLLYRGVTGHCPLYSTLEIDTAAGGGDLTQRGIHVEQAFLINKSAEELYGFWRNFENLPRIMKHLKSVEVIDEQRSHWTARAPRIAGGQVEWDAEITRDAPNSLIAWQSLPGADVDHAGSITFAPTTGDRGTEVHVSMNYVAPAGRAGTWIATLFGDAPEQQIHESLRNFKRLMECGEVVTTEGQPRGACMGLGKLFRE